MVRDDYDGTVLQFSNDGKEYKGQFNILTGNLFPLYKNFVFEFNKKISIFDQISLIFKSKENNLIILGFGIFFGYLIYKYIYLIKRKRKDLVDLALEKRFL